MFARLIAEGRLGPTVGITCRGKTDGAGAQAAAAIAAMAIARFAGCRYRHTPFARMSHAEGAPEDWAGQWETFLNLGDGEIPVSPDAELVALHAAIEHPEAYAGRPIVVFEHWFGLPRKIGPIREALREDLRAKYWRSPKAAIASHLAPPGFTAAIHLRRGDVSATRHAGRYVKDEVALRQIARLKKAIASFGRTLTINLYSEGTAADFRDFAAAGCNLHISGDAFETFHNMVTADILMIAPSSFSHLAALLSDGLVLDHQAHSSPFSGWLRRQRDGDISIKRLRRGLLDQVSWWDRAGYRVRRCWQQTSPIRR